jgi:hypothetical protein
VISVHDDDMRTANPSGFIRICEKNCRIAASVIAKGKKVIEHYQFVHIEFHPTDIAGTISKLHLKGLERLRPRYRILGIYCALKKFRCLTGEYGQGSRHTMWPLLLDRADIRVSKKTVIPVGPKPGTTVVRHIITPLYRLMFYAQ